MDYGRYKSLLPGTIGFTQFKEIVSLCAPPELQYDVEYILRANEVPCTTQDQNQQMGLNLWLITQQPEESKRDFIIKNFQTISA